MKKWLKYTLYSIVVVFALIGVAFTAVYFGMRVGLFNVKGSIDERNKFFSAKEVKDVGVIPCLDNNQKICTWTETPEWAVVKQGLIKDKDIIQKVSLETNVPARLIAATVVPEQLRFFSSNRESFKKYFEPLKILGSLSKFSLGVSGIKQETANAIEVHTIDTTSPFYGADTDKNLITYPADANKADILFQRLTNAHDHYYSYLYTALFLKQVEYQWARAGFDLKNNPGAVITIFNIGFGSSHPNATPTIAGSGITIGGTTYAFGELGNNFYNSDELTDILPK